MSLREQLEMSVAAKLRILSAEGMQRVAEDYARIRFPDRFPRFDFRALSEDSKTRKGWPDSLTDTATRSDGIEATARKDTAAVRKYLDEAIPKAKERRLSGLVIVCGHPKVQFDPGEVRTWRRKFSDQAGIDPQSIHIVCGNALVQELSLPEFARTRLEILGVPLFPNHFKLVRAQCGPDQARLGDFIPSDDDYAQGRVHRPAIADQVLAKLDQDRCALVRGVGACGKSVLAWLLALEAAAQRRPAYILDLAHYIETLSPDTGSALIEDLHRFSHPHSLFILDNCHLAEPLVNEVMAAWKDMSNNQQPRMLLLGRELHTRRGSLIDKLDIEPLVLKAQQAEVRGVYLRLAWQSTGNKPPPEPPPEVLEKWVSTFGGHPQRPDTTTDLIAFSAAARRQMENLLEQRWKLSESDAIYDIHSVYLKKLEAAEKQNLMQLCVMEELEMSLSERSLLDRHDPFPRSNEQRGLVFRQARGRSEQFIHYRLAHPALGSLILRAAHEPVDPVATRLSIARQDPHAASVMVGRLRAIGRAKEASQLLEAMLQTPTFLLSIGPLQYVNRILQLTKRLPVPLPTNFDQTLQHPGAKEQLLKLALQAPLDELATFLRHTATTTALHPLFNALTQELTAPHNLETLVERALKAPFDHLAAFLGCLTTTTALHPLFDALARELFASNHLETLALQALEAQLDQVPTLLDCAATTTALHPLFNTITRELTASKNLKTLLARALQTPLNFLVSFLRYTATTPALQPLFETLAQELAAPKNLKTLVVQALQTPLNHLAGFLCYTARTTALKPLFKVLARELAAPKNLKTLAEKALQTPLNHLATFLSDTATTTGLEPLFNTLTQELRKPPFLPLLVQAMERQPLDTIVGILRLDAAKDLWTAVFAAIDAEAWKKATRVQTTPKIDAFVAFLGIATELKRPELSQSIALRLVHESTHQDWNQKSIGLHHLERVLRQASAATPDNIERFLDRATTPEWIDQRLEDAPPGGLARSILSIALCLQPNRRRWFLREGLSQRVHRELSNINTHDINACAESLALLGAASVMGVSISASTVDWPDTSMLSKVLELRQPLADRTTIGHLESQLWHGLREMSRLRSDVVRIPPEMAEPILALWLTTASDQNSVAPPPHVRALNTTMIAWLRECKINGWRLVPP